MSKSRLSTKDLCIIGVFSALICVLSQIGIPMPYGVPMTLQTFIIAFTGIVLGSKRGLIATCIYVLIGAVGIPVFAGFTGGFGVLFGPTGGFILSFPIIAYFSGKGSETNKLNFCMIFITLGYIINYIFGMIMFSVVSGSTLWIAFISCVLPFIPTSIIKVIISAVLGLKVKNKLMKEGLI